MLDILGGVMTGIGLIGGMADKKTRAKTGLDDFYDADAINRGFTFFDMMDKAEEAKTRSRIGLANRNTTDSMFSAGMGGGMSPGMSMKLASMASDRGLRMGMTDALNAQSATLNARMGLVGADFGARQQGRQAATNAWNADAMDRRSFYSEMLGTGLGTLGQSANLKRADEMFDEDMAFRDSLLDILRGRK